MPNFPFWGFPYRYPHYRYYPYVKNRNVNNSPNLANKENHICKNEPIQKNKSENSQTKNSRHIGKMPFSFNMDGFSNIEKPIIEILGIQLYQDDLIILGLLFFLYKEEVKDESLFISLILLLLS